MNRQPVGRYLQAHLAGASSGIALFGGSRQSDPSIRDQVSAIHAELIEERAFLRDVAAKVGVHEVRAAGLVVRSATAVARLTFGGPGPFRTGLAELAELEAMRDAVAGKTAGWQAMLTIVGELPCERADLERLLSHAERQHGQLVQCHAKVAARDLRSPAEASAT